ncbi:Rod shape-determining protein MreD [Deinococcus planocerae]|uniref:Rod shape-determining protein MreD n=1 Tax=Deinococcus planocerae TaxID=1737569 RepID=UPI001FE9AF2B|nr:Rod shape-determining protein MreD [Deinococcus planocerae]
MTRLRLPALAVGTPGRPVLYVLYALILITVQGVLSRLLDGSPVPPPNLFLLTGVALVWRLRPAAALLGAYGVGLAQDVLGGGALGLHAAGVAGGVLLVLMVRRLVVDSGVIQAVVTVLAATAGQWLAFLFLTYWLRSDLVTTDTLVRTVPLAFLTTLLASPLWERVVNWALGPRAGSQRGLG